MRVFVSVSMLVFVALAGALAPLNAQSALFVTTTDFESGSTAFLPAGSSTADINLLLIHADAVVRFEMGQIYILNRLGQDNVIRLDPDDLTRPQIQFSVGNGSNPYDIKVLRQDKAYVSLFARAEVLIVDPRDGTLLGTIDLSAFSDDDGLPEMGQMVLLGDRLYVTCQLLDRNNQNAPAAHGLLLAVDTNTDQLIDTDPSVEGVQGWTLAAGNPGTLLVAAGKLFVVETAGFFDVAGGVEAIDLATGDSEGFALLESDVGGDITNLALTGPRRGYAVVFSSDFTNSIRPVDLATGAVGDPLEGHSTGFTPSIAVDGNRLIVADRGTFDKPTSAGLLIYDAESGELIAGPIDTGLPPNSIAVLAQAPTAVEDRSDQQVPEHSELYPAYPNPFNPQASIMFDLKPDGFTELIVYDLLGRQVRALAAGYLVAGTHVVAWDGTDDAGMVVGSGSYLVRLRQGEWSQTSKLMLLK